eukprot:TRINITY_DN11749_c0_g1_i1.p1 TRINITY_DN11749_c0_g1~~TRINITY_DN11749_c0_g1_i1.p1  ORF type:complete len:288 (-),score=34.36 TRINITY_DN11749_c0_g1_i1:50-913(-)
MKGLENFGNWFPIKVIYNSNLTHHSTNCSVAIEFANGDFIFEPILIPTCILALTIGIFCGRHILSTKFKGHISYAISFFMFGTMMTCAMMADSILTQTSGSAEFIFAIIDVTLTSSIAISFAFNGLIDVDILKEEKSTYIAMLVSYSLTCAAWLYTFLAGWYMGFYYLYVVVIAVACTAYLLCETYYLFVKGHHAGLGWLVVGAAWGGVGLYTAIYWSPYLCTLFTPWFNGEFWWFIGSDISMYTIYRFWLENRQSQEVKYDVENTPTLYHPVDMSNDNIALVPIYQ